MKKIRLRLCMLFAILLTTSQIIAQIAVTGVVTDSDYGDPLPGVNVVVEGTTQGTVTDIDGKFNIKVPDGDSQLTFTYVGMESQTVTVGEQSIIDVVLGTGKYLEEVVVTALGIKREKKTLGYSTQQVDGGEVTKVKNANFVNSLSGKVAGLDVKTSGTLGASSNVIIRGSSSITGNNQALFVVDGIPISNNISNGTDQASGRGGYDYGNAASDINPEDIESVNVLKGAAATALYGSSAMNGVVLITTKRGKKNAGIGVSASIGYTTGSIDKTTMPRYQKQYGPGYSNVNGWYSGSYATDLGADKNIDGLDYLNDYFGDGESGFVSNNYEDASFGAPFDPSLQVYDWRSFYPELGTYGKKFPYVASDNDATNSFYKSAGTLNANVSFDGGNDDGSFRLSYTYFDQEGIIENSNINRNSISLSGAYDLTSKLNVSSNVNYVYTDAIGRYGTGYSNNNPNQSFRQWYNTGVDMNLQRDAYNTTGLNLTWNPYMHTNNPGVGQTPQDPHYFDNYFFNVWENFPTDNRSRIYGNIALGYDLTDWLNFRVVGSTDRYDELREERIAVGSVDVSSYRKNNNNFQKNQLDMFLETEQYFGANDAISMGAMIGTQLINQKREITEAVTNGGLVIPGLYALSNSVNPIEAPEEYFGQFAKYGYFGRLNFGFNRMLYLDLTGRQDITSTLPPENNSYFYPSAAVSFVFSELFDSNVFDFGKLRLSYAQVGNDANPLNIYDVYSVGTGFNGVTLTSVPTTKNNPNLEPERKNEYEAGLEMNFWRNRLGIDVSVYSNIVNNSILPVTVSGATGFRSTVLNIGEMQNQGIELALNVTPVQSKAFAWDVNVNWGKNVNEVVSLFEDQNNLELSSSQGGISLNATVGEPYGSIWGSNYVFDTNGNPIVIPSNREKGGVSYAVDGVPQPIGNIQPDWKGGINNTFRFADNAVALSFLIDIQKGGSFFSLDTWYGNATGIYENSAGNNREGNPIRDTPEEGGGIYVDGAVTAATDAEGALILDEDGLPTSSGEENTEAFYASDVYTSFGYARGVNAQHIYDASYVKLREAALTFSLPQSIVSKTKVFQALDLSLIGRNLWIIQKNSEYSDPEASLSAGNIGAGNQSGAYPSVREIGVTLKARF